MGIIKTKGIIILENKMDDYDKMLTILTPGYGKISCAAKGAKRNKSLLMAGTQFLCFGEYMLYKGSGTYSMNSCETIEQFYNIRTDYDKLICASNITKIIIDVTTENQNSYKILQLFLNTLYILSETQKDMNLILATFKIRLLCLLGFVPKVKGCQKCNEEDIQYFSIIDNGFKCEKCGKKDISAIKIGQSTKTAIQYIINSSSKKIFSFNLSEESIKELKLVSKIYLNDKLEKEYP